MSSTAIGEPGAVPALAAGRAGVAAAGAPPAGFVSSPPQASASAATAAASELLRAISRIDPPFLRASLPGAA
jgi:hypothetical protein